MFVWGCCEDFEVGVAFAVFAPEPVDVGFGCVGACGCDGVISYVSGVGGVGEDRLKAYGRGSQWVEDGCGGVGLE